MGRNIAFQKRKKRFMKKQLMIGGSAAVLIFLVVVLVLVVLHFMGANKNMEKLFENIVKSSYGETTFGKLADFQWEKGYCFLPYTSREDMEKTLGFSSGKLQDNMVNDDVEYIVFVKNEKVVCHFYTNRSQDITFQLEAGEFTPDSRVWILKGDKGRIVAAKEEGEEKEITEKTEPEQVLEEKMSEEDIYTFLQGPKSWGERRVWSGEWGESFYDGGSFGGFGCGLCCIANLYSSLTEYQCTPVDAYRYAKKTTEYAGGGAIGWGYLRLSLSSMGFQCEVKKKPQTYKSFQQEMAGCMGAVVLVSSWDSECYWKDTPGHYVTIFLYDEQTDKVFLADSGDPEHNRQWVSLRKIYKSLKTESEWQYLPVTGYGSKEDQWKHKKAEGNWVKPESTSK